MKNRFFKPTFCAFSPTGMGEMLSEDNTGTKLKKGVVIKMEIMAEAAIVLFGFSVLMFAFTVSEAAFLVWDKLYKHIRSTKEKAPRTVQRSKAQRKNLCNKIVA